MHGLPNPFVHVKYQRIPAMTIASLCWSLGYELCAVDRKGHGNRRREIPRRSAAYHPEEHQGETAIRGRTAECDFNHTPAANVTGECL
jgi:hypothetical protein